VHFDQWICALELAVDLKMVQQCQITDNHDIVDTHLKTKGPFFMLICCEESADMHCSDFTLTVL